LVKEDIFKEQCLYCGTNVELSDFKTEFQAQLMYKTTICDCGKEVSIKISHGNKSDCSWIEKEVMSDVNINHFLKLK